MDDFSFLLGETSILDDFKSTRGRNSDAFWWKKLNWEPAQVRGWGAVCPAPRWGRAKEKWEAAWAAAKAKGKRAKADLCRLPVQLLPPKGITVSTSRTLEIIQD